ncbi:hypothetical protein [Paenibacillus ginsengarvi]|uniref:Uncharacterized protein n=1 Tax=Paenibacillus ginsengarvi TaxID=400777 RepID=A0A3B0CTG3_9BACL|nr:hypothetical protein [Paenibacillus ginsengarvi]RKN86724.1 hypothetical protein D7M11_01845 [Paenibacillus ginsengarvi]
MKVTPQSIVKPVELTVRPDRQGFIVEDAATRDYYEMSGLCVEALDRMKEGMPLGAIETELKAKYPEEDVDLLDFAKQLLELRLIAELDGTTVETAANETKREARVPRTSGGFGWIPPRAAAALFHPALRFVYILAMLTNVLLLVLRPELFPRYRDVFLFDSMVMNSVVWLALSFVLLMLHELGHIVAVRSFGLPARLGIGHRFVFVVFETEMNGIWSLAPKQRNRAFLAGMGVDQLLLLLCLVVQTTLPGDSGLIPMVAAVAVLDLFLKLAFQCCFFMKTDLYYVAENWTGCYNLMERSRAWLGRKRVGRGGGRADEPLAVRVYAFFYAAGYVLNIVLILFFFAPQLVVSLMTVLPWLAVPSETARFWDAVVFALEIIGLGSLLVYAWRKSRAESAADRGRNFS